MSVDETLFTAAKKILNNATLDIIDRSSLNIQHYKKLLHIIYVQELTFIVVFEVQIIFGRQRFNHV